MSKTVKEIMSRTHRQLNLLSEDSQQELITYYGKDLAIDKYLETYIEKAGELIKGKKKVLDIGCGTGTASIYFAEQGHTVYGIDVSTRLKAANERIKYIFPELSEKITLDLENICSIKKNISPDLIWLEQAYHHLEPRNQVNKIIGELSSPGTYVCIFDENFFNPLSQIAYLRKRGFKTIREVQTKWGKIPVGDERLTYVHYLKRTFAKLGFDHIETIRCKVVPKKYANTLLEKVTSTFARLLPFLYIRYYIVFKKQP